MRGAATLVVCCTEAAGLLGRDTKDSRHVMICRCLGRCSRQPECPRRVPRLVYDRTPQRATGSELPYRFANTATAR
ncbi:hypothetical protein Y032_0268g787 [Ancylostoma ceylanicum]|uniref:Uncharacterized protein n=1 Tax=Ancylostoma ceylanicum TaxID=53326 RepID=A0A016SA19_9BILA|nr:hypothetical protein Y032_0268g787 [Ancylostoma ceylanicum]